MKEDYKRIRKYIDKIGALLLCITCSVIFLLNLNQNNSFGCDVVLADQNTGNCVHDEAGLLNKKTVDEINGINRYTLANVKGHPQIAVFTTEKIDRSMSDYTQKLFDKYKFDTKGYNNGILILINKQNNQVRIATGYGMESILPDLYLKHLIVDSFVPGSDHVTGNGGLSGGGGADSKIRIKIKENNMGDAVNDGVLNMVKEISKRIVVNEGSVKKTGKTDIVDNSVNVYLEEEKETYQGMVVGTVILTIVLFVIVAICGVFMARHPDSSIFDFFDDWLY